MRERMLISQRIPTFKRGDYVTQLVVGGFTRTFGTISTRTTIARLMLRFGGGPVIRWGGKSFEPCAQPAELAPALCQHFVAARL